MSRLYSATHLGHVCLCEGPSCVHDRINRMRFRLRYDRGHSVRLMALRQIKLLSQVSAEEKLVSLDALFTTLFLMRLAHGVLHQITLQGRL